MRPAAVVIILFFVLAPAAPAVADPATEARARVTQANVAAAIAFEAGDARAAEAQLRGAIAAAERGGVIESTEGQRAIENLTIVLIDEGRDEAAAPAVVPAPPYPRRTRGRHPGGRAKSGPLTVAPEALG
jgi:hypothetical protein